VLDDQSAAVAQESGGMAVSGPPKRAATAALVNGPAGPGKTTGSVAAVTSEDSEGVLEGGVMLRRRQPENLAVEIDAPKVSEAWEELLDGRRACQIAVRLRNGSRCSRGRCVLPVVNWVDFLTSALK